MKLGIVVSFKLKPRDHVCGVSVLFPSVLTFKEAKKNFIQFLLDGGQFSEIHRRIS